MSKVLIALDTKTDELIVSVDGKELKSVSEVTIYSYGELEVSISIGQMEPAAEEGDLRTYTRLIAAVKGDIGPAEAVDRPVYQDIANFLGKYNV